MPVYIISNFIREKEQREKASMGRTNGFLGGTMGIRKFVIMFVHTDASSLLSGR